MRLLLEKCILNRKICNKFSPFKNDHYESEIDDKCSQYCIFIFWYEEEDPDLQAIDLVLSYILDEEILPKLFTFFDRKSRGVIANADIYYLVYLILFSIGEVLIAWDI